MAQVGGISGEQPAWGAAAGQDEALLAAAAGDPQAGAAHPASHVQQWAGTPRSTCSPAAV